MEDIRKLLTTYAYNILGSYEDAKDVVQDAYLKFYNKDDSDSIDNKKSYLIRTVINLSINLKKRKNVLLREYPGEYLPEPLATEKADANILRQDILSYSLMVLLDKLNPKQRAVFILKEAFDYDHKEISEVLHMTEENSRKMLSRAKQELKNPRIAVNSASNKEYVDKYLQVIYNGDVEELENLLHDDISIISDGGGKASAILRPLYGKSVAAKFLVGIYRKFYSTGDIRIQKTYINHQPALLLYKNQKLSVCQVFEFDNENISRIYFVRNPDKLRSL
jgi:RNA polymerase sigma-70 factor (ECF subfamily)